MENSIWLKEVLFKVLPKPLWGRDYLKLHPNCQGSLARHVNSELTCWSMLCEWSNWIHRWYTFLLHLASIHPIILFQRRPLPRPEHNSGVVVCVQLWGLASQVHTYHSLVLILLEILKHSAEKCIFYLISFLKKGFLN